MFYNYVVLRQREIGPREESVGQIRDFQKLFLAPGFLSYCGVLIGISLVIVFYFAPRYAYLTPSILYLCLTNTRGAGEGKTTCCGTSPYAA